MGSKSKRVRENLILDTAVVTGESCLAHILFQKIAESYTPATQSIITARRWKAGDAGATQFWKIEVKMGMFVI